MNKYLHAGVIALVSIGVVACGESTNIDNFRSVSNPGTKPYNALIDAVPRANCKGPNDRREPGIQGRTRAVEDVASGLADLGYQCNLELVGHEGDVALWQMAWFEDCAYYTLGAPPFGHGSGTSSSAVVVDDVTDSANPKRATTLTTPAMLDPWESLKVNEKRGLLAAVGPGVSGPFNFDVYDLNGDCKNPALQVSAPVNAVGHEGEWAPDGKTYYGSAFVTSIITPIDVSNPLTPTPLAQLQYQTHGLSISDDGNRMYLARSNAPNGLVILDSSQIQARALNPGVTKVSEVTWLDGAVAQMTIPVKIKGKPYVIIIDEGGGMDPALHPSQQQPGMARIVDISDETKPVVVSKLKNEIDQPEHGDERATDGGASGFTYQGHYCGVPKRDDPEVLACSYFWQGIRVFDIRDPVKPREIAYFVPGDEGANAPGAKGLTSSAVRFKTDRNEIWFTDQFHGLMIARFTQPLADLLGPAPSTVPATVTSTSPAAVATTATGEARRGKFGGAFGLGLLLPLLASVLHRRRRLSAAQHRHRVVVLPFCIS